MEEYLELEREIKGYVEIQYSNICNNTNQDYNFPSPAPICFPTSVISGNNKACNNYASLEKDYFLLDGSFVLPDYNYTTLNDRYGNDNAGYISDEILEEYSYYTELQPYNEVTNESDTMRGLTIYFKDNIPSTLKIKVKIYNSDKILDFSIENNSKSVIEFDFEDDYLVERISYYFSDMEYEDRRLRICYIDYGLTDLLSKENGNLIQFSVVENIGEFNLEFPSNECTIELYDEDKKFDLLNPKNFANLLNENVMIKPYIGIVTKEDIVVYENKGTYFLNNWSNQNQNVTLTCSDYINKIKNIISYTRFFEDLGSLANFGNLDCYYGLSTVQQEIKEESGIDIKGLPEFSEGRYGGDYYDDKYVETTYLLDYLKELVVWLCGGLYSYNGLLIGAPSSDYTPTLTLNTSLLEEPKYEVKDKLKSISITKYKGETVEYLDEEELAYEVDMRNSTKAIVDLGSYMSGRIEYYDSNKSKFATYNFNCKKLLSVENTSKGSVKIFQTANVDLKTETEIRNYNIDGKSIEIDNKFFKEYTGSNGSSADSLNTRCDKVFNFIKDNYKTYNVTINYIGNPFILPSGYVNVETRYGLKQVRVLKHTLTFNGGLSGVIEGVGD